MHGSIRQRLTLAFIALAIGPLLLVGVVLAWQSFTTQQQQALNLQHEVAQRVATQVTAFFKERENELRVVSQVQGLQELDRDRQRSNLSELLSYQDVFETLVLLNDKGQEQVHLSRISFASIDLGNRAEADEFVIPQTSGEIYYSPIRFEETTGEPFMTIAVPLFDVRTALVNGVLVSEVRIKKIWDLIADVRVSPGQSVYIVDAQDKVVAHRNPSVVLQTTTFHPPDQDGIQPGLTSVNPMLAVDTHEGLSIQALVAQLTNSNVVLAVDTVRFGEQEFNIIAEQTVDEALALAINAILITLGLIVAVLIISITLGFLIVRQIVQPIQTLAATAQAISAGDLSQQVQIIRQDELGVLANAFNGMTRQLRDLIDSLEQRVADRTHRLEIVATLGEQLNAILDPGDLLRECVNQVKQKFNYYHAHIYLLDEARENLVVAAGAGLAGQEMAARRHQIPLQAAKSLVAQTARSKTIVAVDDAQADPTWLPNPWLPNTRSEMAVPILQEGEVVGVLDVQADRVAGLDESDANLLRSLANQVAVALSNARLFEQTTRSKEEAERARQEIEVAKQALEVQMWQTAGQALLNDRMRGEQDTGILAGNVIQQVCKYLNAQVGALYAIEDHNLHLAGSYAYTPSKNQVQQLHLGEGLAGQAALEKQILVVGNVPSDALTLTLSLGEMIPRHFLAAPFAYNGQVAGVIELGTLTEFSPMQMEFLHKALESIAIAFTTAQARHQVNELLEETRRQAEELQAQEEELRAANEELESQAESLRASEAKLKVNQEQLQETNAELEEKAEALEKNSAVLREQQAALDRQNRELKTAQEELEQKAQELALASKYKSEFLANMSHELRTPLNSLLILAGMLAKNEDGNLTPDQVESIQIIHNGGTDLLNLINDILDLSKIEAGKVEFRFAPMALERLAASMRAQFSHVAEGKGLAFEINLADDLPPTIETDQQRVEQIVKNLLSNAFKFTHQGGVRLNLYRPQPGIDLSKNGLEPSQAIAISVSDTGIGMTPDQQKIVFEAFQQADSSTSRQYGGTGLGLSISRELVTKLGGQIELVSEKGQGSTFTLYLPINRPEVSEKQPEAGEEVKTQGRLPLFPAEASAGRQGYQRAGANGHPSLPSESLRPASGTPEGAKEIGTPKDGSNGATPPSFHPPIPTPQPPSSTLTDDRDMLQPGDRVLLIIEDDPHFAKVVVDYAHKKGFKCLLAAEGETGLILARTYPSDAIILDLDLPKMNGWEVLNALKDNPDTRHIPVHIMSAADEDLDAYKHGAIGFLTKPVDQADLDGSFQKIEGIIARQIKSLLLVEDDANLRKSVRKLLEGNDVVISEADLGQTALEQLAAQSFDCMILDLSLPDMSGFELLNQLNTDETLSKCPVIVYTGKALTEEENRELLKYADSVIVKGVKSPERLLDETALFLHRVIANLPEEKQQAIKRLHDSEAILVDKNILVVDDDARNAFALSKLLSGKGLKVHIVPSGQKALEVLGRTSMDLVLMDIMMPGMDGYETTRRIRAQVGFRTLPILALTAKAMKGDREKCLEAGANDYLSKPIDPDRLFSMLRVWLSRE